MSAILEQTSAGGYRYQLTCIEGKIVDRGGVYSASNPYGGLLCVTARGAEIRQMTVDGVTSIPEPDALLTELYTSGSHYTYRIPFGESISVTAPSSAPVDIVLYKYQRIAETS